MATNLDEWEAPALIKLYLKSFEGWVSHFNTPWELRDVISDGESGDSYVPAVEQTFPLLGQILSQFDLKGNYNADECGLNYSMTPDKNVAHMPLPGRKNSKGRLNLLFCTNADG